jgi:hypothetical protein
MFLTVEMPNGKLVYGKERVLSRGSLRRLLAKVGTEQESSRYYPLFAARPIFEPLFEVERRISSSWLAPLFNH